MCVKFLVLYILIGDSQANWGQLAAVFQRAFKRFLCKNLFAILNVELMSHSMFDKRKQIVFGRLWC